MRLSASAGEPHVDDQEYFRRLPLYPAFDCAGAGAADLMGLDQKLSMLAGLIACLLGAEAHAAIARGVERRLVRRELAELTGVAKGLAHELDQAGERIVE